MMPRDEQAAPGDLLVAPEVWWPTSKKSTAAIHFVDSCTNSASMKGADWPR